ncbi:ABC transporter ATP-binding protein [Brevundimonas sp.]|uniref:ABC transporter ATP-binding protein n=1 Tax=Brevundimonas sp. TaxID=1871086 RepID=UPI00391DE53A
MIELIDVEKSYRTRLGLRPVIRPTNLAFYRGASTAVLGLNGAGKSTLLRLISGVERPDRGEIRRSVTVSSPLGLTGAFHATMTGAENLKFVCRIYRKDVDAVTDFVRDFAELGAYFHEPIENYSSGMKSRLAFALSLAVDFQVYVIDEGLSVGDAAFRNKAQEAFAERRARSDIIMTSHSTSTIREFCSRAVVMDQGQAVPFESLDAAEDYYMEIVARGRAA